MTSDLDHIGVVIIGRNEGPRLIAAFESLKTAALSRVIYVDSGSSDSSVKEARNRGYTVVELDMSIPFSAARARNAGAAVLLEGQAEPPKYLLFIDGDCRLDPAWPTAALLAFEQDDTLAVVCGRRREIKPEASLYNRICDDEWDTPIGNARACGGDSVMRADAFQSVGGFNATVIAGEEPELCFRLRRDGWSIKRIDAEMTLHDANIHLFSQWAKRTERAGYAFTLGALMHGASPELYYVRETLRILIWAGLFPVAIILGGIVSPTALFLLAVYPLQFLRLAQTQTRLSDDRWSVAGLTLIGKFYEAKGSARCLLDSLTRRNRSIIEYKAPN